MDKRSEENQRVDSDVEVISETMITSEKREREFDLSEFDLSVFDLSEFEFQPKNKIQKTIPKPKESVDKPKRESKLCWFCEKKECRNPEPKLYVDDFKVEELLQNRMLDERRFYFTPSNSMWLSIGLKPSFKKTLKGRKLQRLDVAVEPAMYLIDLRGYRMNFTLSQFGLLLELIRRIPGIKLNDESLTADDETQIRCQRIKIVKNDEVYHIYNGATKSGEYIELDITMLQQILDLAELVTSVCRTQHRGYAEDAFVELEREIIKLSIKSGYKKTFKLKVMEAISEIRRQNWIEHRLLMKEVYDDHFIIDMCVMLLLEIVNNFPDFVCEHLWREEKLLERNPNGERYSADVRDEKWGGDDENDE